MAISLILTTAFCFTLFLIYEYSISAHQFPHDSPMANLSTLWINNISASTNFSDESSVRSILVRGSFGSGFACGFFCNGSCDSNFFAIYIVQTNSGSDIVMPYIEAPQVVWSANLNNPVKSNATLELTSDGDLILRDFDGILAWSTNTSGKSVAGLNLTDTGNLVLFDVNNSTVWQSFDHPTDCLVPGQKLVAGQKLIAGLYSLLVNGRGLFGFLNSDPPQSYYEFPASDVPSVHVPSVPASDVPSLPISDDHLVPASIDNYVIFLNGSLVLYMDSFPGSSTQYMKLGSDGHLRVYEWTNDDGWKEVADLLEMSFLGDCQYPTVCGKYGVCSNGQCSCPGMSGSTSYFQPINEREPNLGCSQLTNLTCDASQNHSLVELKNVSYFMLNVSINNTDIGTCKQACLNDCACKAAIFRYDFISSISSCYLPLEIFSLMNIEPEETPYNSTAFIKVQIPSIKSSTPARIVKKRNKYAIIFGSTIAKILVVLLSVLIIVGIGVFVFWRKRKVNDEVEEDYLDKVPGMPERFSYETLKAATRNFSNKLGQGGFGSVFEGTLEDGTRIAVKCLGGLPQDKKSFLAEVQSIGSVHHVNLVRLVGVCADKTNRLLVYEYMENGSLDKWIFHKNHEPSRLDWKTKREIVLDIAKGLAYIHEDCRQKIMHLDIKPHNILLDEQNNAKISDFGLAKQIEKNKSQSIWTTVRGTPGYLAPECLNSAITEKVDVYSFGVVVLETMCGRKVFDSSQPEENLLSFFGKRAEEGKMLELVDNLSEEDVRLHETQIVDMMKVAAWCLQRDPAERPSTSNVIKVLEGVMPVPQDIDFTFSIPSEAITADSTPLVPSVLSGPR